MAAKTPHTLCECGCDERTTSLSARYLPGHAPKTLRIEAAAGQVVKLINISEEPDAYAKVGAIKDQGIIIEFTVIDHPTCGDFSWAYPRGTVLELQPQYRKRK